MGYDLNEVERLCRASYKLGYLETVADTDTAVDYADDTSR